MRLRTALFALLGPALVFPALHADTMGVTITGTGSGTLGGTPFGPTTITATSTYDTSNINSGSDGGPGTVYASAVNSPVDFSIGGVGTAVESTAGYFVDDNGYGIVGFASAGQNPTLILEGNSAFDSYHLAVPLSSTSGTLYIGSAESTSLGSLKFTSGTFTVTVTDMSTTPEPSSLMLLGTAMVGVGGVARRRLLAR